MGCIDPSQVFLRMSHNLQVPLPRCLNSRIITQEMESLWGETQKATILFESPRGQLLFERFCSPFGPLNDCGAIFSTFLFNPPPPLILFPPQCYHPKGKASRVYFLKQKAQNTPPTHTLSHLQPTQWSLIWLRILD